MCAYYAKILSERSTKGQQFIDSEMVDIHVGKDEDSGHFQLHKSILCEKVPYFEKMFNGNFEEGTTNSATLPEDDPEAFNILISWIYSDQVFPVGLRECTHETWCVGKLYLLADKLCLPDLMDRILDELTFSMDKDNWMPNITMNTPLSVPLSVQNLYKCCPRENCGMFRLLVSLMCHLLCETYNAHCLETWPTEEIDSFLTCHDDLRHEVFKMMRTEREHTTFSEQLFKPGCRVHEHGEDQPCSQLYRRANKQTEQDS
ncbi:uncharacterized protein EAF02_003624 [Botrytis sinoallii]|uniref:uncharacterized protein n=1 Tax=Botrytis sinoallii TaxID=1463999 RepID=UPI0018FFD4B7|nr:uncharacterized protein EAF02_003624 [Botrytis sinoallii]KAF7886977.1 hypothetical protein EAF02_003624 [Botrytis sinoallii]